jgi:hypothetical protein
MKQTIPTIGGASIPRWGTLRFVSGGLGDQPERQMKTNWICFFTKDRPKISLTDKIG